MEGGIEGNQLASFRQFLSPGRINILPWSNQGSIIDGTFANLSAWCSRSN
jgi:hypothetical protein